jgi:O-antigen ligase
MSSITSELFEFNKMLFIYGISILVLFFWVLKMILLKKIILKKTPFDIPFLIFIGSQVTSTLFSIDKHTSLFGYYGRFNGGLLSILSYAILYFGFTANFLGSESGKIIQKLFKTSLVSSFLVILWGLPGRLGFDLSCFIFTGRLNNACWTDQFHPELRMFSTLGQPNWLGAYLAINFFLAFYFLLRIMFVPEFDYSKKEKKGYVERHKKSMLVPLLLLYGYLFLNFSSILFTRSRSAFISVIGGLLLCCGYVIIQRRIKQILPLLFIAFISILIFKTGFQSLDRYLTFSFSTKKPVMSVSQPPQAPTYKVQISESFDIRKVVWKGAIDLANKFPLFGSGVETFAYAYYFVRPISHNATSEWDYLYNKAHNEYLNYAATTGYIGLVSYLFMIGICIWLTLKQIFKQKSNDEVFLMISLILAYFSILITNFFGFSTTTINLFFYGIPAIGMVVLYKKDEKESQQNLYDSSSSTSQWLYIGISTLVAIFLIISVVNYFLADVNYARADAFSKNGDYQSSARLLTQALKYRYEHVYEDKLSYVLTNLAVLASYQKQAKLTTDIQTLAENYNKKSIEASPKNVLYWKTRAKNQYLFYQISLNSQPLEEGIKALNQARELAPTDPKIPYSLAIFKSLLYDEEKDRSQKEELRQQSLQHVNESIDLKPDFRDSYFLKAQLLKKYGDKIGARRALEFILKELNPADEEVKKELESL